MFTKLKYSLATAFAFYSVLSHGSSVTDVSNSDAYDLCNGDVDCGISTLSASLTGFLVTESSPGDNDEYNTYKQSRWTYWNAQDLHPLVIIFVDSTDDVVLSLEFIQYFDLCYGIHSSVITHNARAGDEVVSDSCVTISFRLMNDGEVRYDSENDEYSFVAQPGLMTKQILPILGDYYDETGKALLYPIGSAGTLSMGGNPYGGGFGSHVRKLGPTAYHFKSATIVTADLQVITANEDNEHADLFWALRGGGQTMFGLVVESEFKLTEMDSDEAVFWIKYFDYDDSLFEDMFDLLEANNDGANNLESSGRYWIWPDKIRAQYFYIGSYEQGWPEYVKVQSELEDIGLVPQTGGFARNTSLYRGANGVASNPDFEGREIPARGRFIFGLTDEIKSGMAQLLRDTNNMIATINNENGYKLYCFFHWYARGGQTGLYDLDFKKSAFPWRDTNLYEVNFFIQYESLNDDTLDSEQLSAGVGVSEFVRDGLNDLGLTRQYINVLRFDAKFDEFDWKDTYYGYNDNQYVYNRMTKVKCQYDPDWFFNVTQPVPPVCDSQDSSSSDSSDD